MGIYDRDYYQEPQPGMRIGGNFSIVTKLIILNSVIYFADALFFEGQLCHSLALKSNLVQQPWKCWELLTYGFAHDPSNIVHLLGNMFCLWFFGRDVEPIYGGSKFLGFYLTAIIFAGVIGGVGESLVRGSWGTMLGASGGVAAVIILYVCHFPRRELLFWGVIPIRAWMLGVMFLLWDFVGTFDPKSTVAHTAHFAGAAYGYFFFRTKWDLSLLVPGAGLIRRLRRPKVRIHQPDAAEEDSMSVEVDRILEKIGQTGEGSLTAKERDVLQRASRRYQRKHR
jgi:membrane associated rhomboid family serine protease